MVDVREVGPRDGLQPERPLSIDDRLALIAGLLEAGVTHIEVAAFVSPKAVPAMAGAADLLSRLARPSGVTVTVLVPNLRGAQMALETAAVDEITVTISASETYNRRNVARSVAESLEEVEAITSITSQAGVPVDAVVSCAFGSPYEGDAEPGDVAALGGRLLDVGCARVTYADTTGMATPNRIEALLDATGTDVGLHLHQTRGTALLNAWVGLQRGVRRFDTSVGGLGGSPFAAGAAGNLATEEWVAVLDDCGFETGIDVEGLVGLAPLLTNLVGHQLPSAVATAGTRARRAEERD